MAQTKPRVQISTGPQARGPKIRGRVPRCSGLGASLASENLGKPCTFSHEYFFWGKITYICSSQPHSQLKNKLTVVDTVLS